MYNYYNKENFDCKYGQNRQYNYEKNREDWDNDEQFNLYPDEAKFFFEGYVKADNGRDYDEKEEQWDNKKDDNKCNHRPSFRPCFPCFPCFNRICNCNQNNNHEKEDCRKDNEWQNRPCREHNRPCFDDKKENKKKQTVLFINGRIVIKDC